MIRKMQVYSFRVSKNENCVLSKGISYSSDMWKIK